MSPGQVAKSKPIGKRVTWHYYLDWFLRKVGGVVVIIAQILQLLLDD